MAEIREACRVAIAVLNWNGVAHLKRFLPSVLAYASEQDRVVVIDNGSDDGSASLLRQDFPEVVRIQLDENLGFAGGYNVGLDLLGEQLDAEWVLLLNSDVEVTPGWVDALVAASTRWGWAAAQPKIRALDRRAEFEYAGAAGGYMDRFGFMFCAGRIFNTFEVDHGQYDTDREVFWASGAALLVRHAAWRQVGGLDVDFFAHMEEIDLCWRLRNRGHKVGVVTSTHVYHLGGGTLAESSPRKAELNFRNNLFLLLKNDHRAGIGLRLFLRQCIDGIAAVRFLFEGKPDFFKAVIRGHGAFRRTRREMIRKRREEQGVCSGQPGVFEKPGYFKDSIVVAYFLKGKRRWTDLPVDRFS